MFRANKKFLYTLLTGLAFVNQLGYAGTTTMVQTGTGAPNTTGTFNFNSGAGTYTYTVSPGGYITGTKSAGATFGNSLDGLAFNKLMLMPDPRSDSSPLFISNCTTAGVSRNVVGLATNWRLSSLALGLAPMSTLTHPAGFAGALTVAANSTAKLRVSSYLIDGSYLGLNGSVANNNGFVSAVALMTNDAGYTDLNATVRLRSGRFYDCDKGVSAFIDNGQRQEQIMFVTQKTIVSQTFTDYVTNNTGTGFSWKLDNHTAPSRNRVAWSYSNGTLYVKTAGSADTPITGAGNLISFTNIALNSPAAGMFTADMTAAAGGSSTKAMGIFNDDANFLAITGQVPGDTTNAWSFIMPVAPAYVTVDALSSSYSFAGNTPGTITATLRNPTGRAVTVTASSSNTSVVTIASNTATIPKWGSATMTFQVAAGYGINSVNLQFAYAPGAERGLASVTRLVTANIMRGVSSHDITAVTPTAGTSGTHTLTTTFSNARQQNTTAAFTFTSSDTSVLREDGSGGWSAVAQGTARVTATAFGGAMTATKNITVCGAGGGRGFIRRNVAGRGGVADEDVAAAEGECPAEAIGGDLVPGDELVPAGD